MIENLVFSGGGVRCISYIGVLKLFEEKEITKNIKQIISTSGGSIFGLVLIIGYTYEELKSLVLGLDFENIRDITSENLFEFFNNYGIDTGNKLLLLINLLITKKGLNKEITFLELYDKFKIKFTVTGTCVNTKKVEYFNYKDTPNMQVSLAIRISTSVPIIFNHVNYNNKVYVDGGIIENYPIDLLKNELDKTIGFCICSDSKDFTKITGIDSYIINILFAVTKKLEDIIKNKYTKQTINIRSNLNHMNFNLSNEEKACCINNGYETTKKFFDKMEEKKSKLTNDSAKLDQSNTNFKINDKVV